MAVISFSTDNHRMIDSTEVVEDKNTIRVIPEAIPPMERRILCATILEAALRFFRAPENEAAFRRWREARGGVANGPENGE